MHRRGFLQAGVSAGVGAAAIGTVGCGGLGLHLDPAASLPPPSDAEMAAFFKRLDGNMEAVSKGPNPVAKLVPGARLPDTPEFLRGDEVLRKALRSMLLVGSFHDLPEEGRVHPEMQDRMWCGMADMDSGMLGVHELLSELTPTERADLGRLMRKDPDLGMRVVEAIDDHAAATGVPMKRRLHLREIASHVCFRLRQSTPLFLDEYTGKVERVKARRGSVEEVQRRLATQMGDQAFWAFHARTVAMAGQWRVADAAPASHVEEEEEESTAHPAPPPPAPAHHPKGGGAITAGAILLGVAAVSAGTGALIVSAGAFGGVFLITLGALLGIGGLITLLVGLILRAAG
jgi:hypothetical protein